MADTAKELSVVEAQFSLAPRNMTEAMEFAKLMAASEVVPKDYKGKPGDILVAVAMGMEVGLKPLQALQSIACINGRPTIWGDGALALIRKSGLLEEMDEDDAKAALANKVGRCRVKRKGSPACPKDPTGRCTNQLKNISASCCTQRTFSLDDANRANLIERSKGDKGVGPWISYPGRMLQMRARSWALRDTFADVLKGLQVREEVEDYGKDYESAGTTDAGHEILRPKRKAEASSLFTSAVAADHAPVAETPASVDDFVKDTAPPPPVIDRSKLVKVMLHGSVEKTGGGKTFYVLTFEGTSGGKQEASTFDRKQHDLALTCRGSFVLIETKKVQKGEKTYTNLVYIEKAPDQVDVPPEQDEPGSAG